MDQRRFMSLFPCVVRKHGGKARKRERRPKKAGMIATTAKTTKKNGRENKRKPKYEGREREREKKSKGGSIQGADKRERRRGAGEEKTKGKKKVGWGGGGRQERGKDMPASHPYRRALQTLLTRLSQANARPHRDRVGGRGGANGLGS